MGFIFLWLLLFIIPGVVKILAYSQTYYILKDHPDYSATEAISASRRLMKGHKWNFFVFGISFIGWAFLATIPLFIGYLWFIPYISAAVAVYYQNLTDQLTPDDVLKIKPNADPS
jgi:Predicted integral membrane protein